MIKAEREPGTPEKGKTPFQARGSRPITKKKRGFHICEHVPNMKTSLLSAYPARCYLKSKKNINYWKYY